MLYTKTPPDLSVVTEHLCYIKFYDTKIKRFNFIATDYGKEIIADVGICLVIKGNLLDKDSRVFIYENAKQLIYSIQIANKFSWQIEEEFLKYNIIHSLELDKDNNIILTFTTTTDLTIKHEPKIILR